jgi:hypothetical protein
MAEIEPHWSCLKTERWEGPVYTRGSEIRAAYDCSDDRSLCMHSKSAQHGFRFIEWAYAVTDKSYFLTLGICAFQVQPGVPIPGRYLHVLNSRPMPLTLNFKQILYDDSGKGRGTKTVWFNSGGQFFREWPVLTYEQPEEFWLKLEGMLAGERRKTQS